MNLEEVCDRQNEIIKQQSEIIDDLFLQLLNYVSIDEEERNLARMQAVADLKTHGNAR